MSTNLEIREERQLLYETRSEDVQEIMGRMPSWILRYGIVSIGVILCLLLAGTHFIRYPDKVYARVSVTSDNPPVKIIAENSGRIKNIRVAQNANVQKDAVLLELDDAANFDDVISLKNSLVRQLNDDPIQVSFPRNQYQLGALQDQYEELLMMVEDLNFFVKNDNSYLSEIQLEKQISENNNLYSQLVSNEARVKERVAIDQNNFETSETLYRKKVITESDFLLAKKQWLDQQNNLNANKNSMISNALKESELRKNILDINQQRKRTLFEAKRKVELGMKGLLQQIQKWENGNVIKAPVAGRVNLYSVWKENQYVYAGQNIMLIIPESQNLIAKGEIQISSSGNVKVGQPVLINMLSHPQNEYGYVEGTISYISSAPLDSVYSFDIKLTDGLHTSGDKVIIPQPQMYGYGEILTDDKSELTRIFEQFKK